MLDLATVDDTLVTSLQAKPTSAGLSNEVVHLLLASGVKKIGDGGGVSGESIKVHLVPVDKVLSWCRRFERRTGGLTSPNVVAALALLAE